MEIQTHKRMRKANFSWNKVLLEEVAFEQPMCSWQQSGVPNAVCGRITAKGIPHKRFEIKEVSEQSGFDPPRSTRHTHLGEKKKHRARTFVLPDRRAAAVQVSGIGTMADRNGPFSVVRLQ